ncbi:MAG: T9SS type A sorting domain-containing protein [Sporocytophaga sp.]|uniref:T9SS type A sorting domain-containing protein n=1 Tax=Sporocytophaga sp. TaxID=2231183 RepID=UPI001B0643C3|nr:T9SS type A sorting domain-containing protein [Sporocytophaga sp.]MBO9699946.1 T9SS type A sorting domain-containing protein [Sporocytophaga sp.]
MKKLLTTFSLVFIALVTYGQTLNPEKLSFGYKAGESKTFSVNTCSTCPWVVVSIPEWVIVDNDEPVIGPGTITVTTIQDNPSIFEARPSFVIIQLTAFDAYLPIEQAPAPEDVSSISDQQLTKNISIFPNPSNGVVNIQSDTDEISVKVFNHLGQIIRTYKSSLNHSFDLPKGFYLIESTNNLGYMSISKIIVE